jgi:hypothetical protein
MNNTNIIYSDIIQELEVLLNITPENENLNILRKAADYFQDNKEALLVIRNGLIHINDGILKIKHEENEALSSVVKNILDSIEYKI